MLGGAPAGLPGVGPLAGRIAGWLARRSLAPTSVTGISLALGFCAGVWFTAGTGPANLKGAVALGACYLAALTARQLTASAGIASAGIASAGTGLADTGLAGQAGWLAVLGGCCCECAVLAGLAAGAAVQGWASMWPLAITVLALVAVRETMTACARPGDASSAQDGQVRRAVETVLTMPAGGRVLLLVVAVPLWGARAGLLGLLDWAIIAVGYGIGSGTTWRRVREPEPDAMVARAPEPTSLAVLLRPAEPVPFAEPGTLAPEFSAEPLTAGPSVGQEIGVIDDLLDDDVSYEPAEPAEPGEPDPDQAGGWAEAAAEQRGIEAVLRCRDDGAISRWLGRLARGQLMPLPPALLALAAVAMLAHLGLGDLPGLLILAPAIVMLLAGPGASHPHDGRFDWLAPALPLGAQYLYITALGSASRVPVAVTFVLGVAIAVHYADLDCETSPAAQVRGQAGPEPGGRVRSALASGTWLGWDGRMIVCGLGAAMGIAMFAYLALAAYLGVLICWKVMTSCLGLREGDCR